MDVEFEHLGGDDPRTAWFDAHDGEGGRYSLWTAKEAPGGLIEITVSEPRDGLPPRVEIKWLDLRAVQAAQAAEGHARRAATAKRAATRAAKRAAAVQRAAAASVVSLDEWRRLRRAGRNT
jgi:hypothetical protein